MPLPRCLRTWPLAVFGFASAVALADAGLPRDLVLAGGGLGLCTDLAPGACATPLPPGGRAPARYRWDADARSRLDGLAVLQDAVPAERRAAWFDRIASALGDAELDADALHDALAEVCVADRCDGDGPAVDRPWSRLDDAARAAVFAALEQPAVPAGTPRPRERAFPENSRDPGGRAVLQALVDAARTRAGGRRPRIAIVTASALDPMEPVDAYLALFDAMGAEAVWWPIDPALASARFVHEDCGTLDAERQRRSLPNRATVYPDLAAWQQDYCAAQPALLMTVQGLFFTGGDQSRIRATLADAEGRPNAWGRELQEAWQRGALAVGGSSAGSAVQGSAWMLASGTVEAAVAWPARVGPPVPSGCSRAGRCREADEDALVLDPRGGLGLARDAIVDTHFSERARELRLLVAMHAAGAAWGYGADEGSALHVREGDTHREIRAVGRHGGWVLRRDPSDRDAVSAWYLAPGAVLRVDAPGTTEERVAVQVDPSASRPARPRGPRPSSAFDEGALRAAAWRLAYRCSRPQSLPAGEARAVLACTEGTLAWRGANGVPGIGPLRLRLERPPAP